MSVMTEFAIATAILIVGSGGIAAWFTFLCKREKQRNPHSMVVSAE